MITPNKLANALHALQDVIIRGRTMAYEKADHVQIADLLDTAGKLGDARQKAQVSCGIG